MRCPLPCWPGTRPRYVPHITESRHGHHILPAHLHLPMRATDPRERHLLAPCCPTRGHTQIHGPVEIGGWRCPWALEPLFPSPFWSSCAGDFLLWGHLCSGDVCALRTSCSTELMTARHKHGTLALALAPESPSDAASVTRHEHRPWLGPDPLLGTNARLAVARSGVRILNPRGQDGTRSGWAGADSGAETGHLSSPGDPQGPGTVLTTGCEPPPRPCPEGTWTPASSDAWRGQGCREFSLKISKFSLVHLCCSTCFTQVTAEWDSRPFQGSLWSPASVHCGLLPWQPRTLQ